MGENGSLRGKSLPDSVPGTGKGFNRKPTVFGPPYSSFNARNGDINHKQMVVNKRAPAEKFVHGPDHSETTIIYKDTPLFMLKKPYENDDVATQEDGFLFDRLNGLVPRIASDTKTGFNPEEAEFLAMAKFQDRAHVVGLNGRLTYVSDQVPFLSLHTSGTAEFHVAEDVGAGEGLILVPATTKDLNKLKTEAPKPANGIPHEPTFIAKPARAVDDARNKYKLFLFYLKSGGDMKKLVATRNGHIVGLKREFDALTSFYFLEKGSGGDGLSAKDRAKNIFKDFESETMYALKFRKIVKAVFTESSKNARFYTQPRLRATNFAPAGTRLHATFDF